MKKILYSLLALFGGLVLSSGSCNSDPFNPSIYDEGEVINGVRWATRNVDTPGKFAESSSKAGMLYQWGRNKEWPFTDPLSDTWPTAPAGGTIWAEGSNPCPKDWRLPTKAEIESLLDKTVPQFWSLVGADKGVYLGTFPHRIFLPIISIRFEDGTISLNYSGGFWSSTPINSTEAWAFDFNIDENISANSVYEKCSGLSVRCVKK
ncbi:MAG: DUF1566 domain-containing protein [Prevotellaceae bacterium]|jgi:hypothetical protein|nr:DUF1566 domain-containing protein [Prevotellaceae bacterium]